MAMGWPRSRHGKLKVFNLRRFLGNSMHLANVFAVAACGLACAEHTGPEPQAVAANVAAAGA